MIPETAASLLAFLLLISPGLIFQWLRRRHRPSTERTAFDEIATVVVASVIFSSVSVGSLIAVDAGFGGPMSGMWEWLRDGNDYFVQHPRRSIATVLAAVTIAWAAAVAANWLISRESVGERYQEVARRVAGISIDHEVGLHSTWWSILRERVPNHSQVWMTVELEGGRQHKGLVHAYDIEGESDARILVLEQPLTTLIDHEWKPLDPSGNWKLLVIPMREIRASTILYNRPRPAE